MSEHPRRPLKEMRAAAERLRAEILPFCERCEIAGSIRRGLPTVADIELVAIARLGDAPIPGEMFARRRVDLLHSYCARQVAAGNWQHRLDVNGRPSFGDKYKRLLVDGAPLDLFATTADNWGVIFMIRTGPADWSHRFVTAQRIGGSMPDGWCVSQGALWHKGTHVRTPEEACVFEALGLPYVEPSERR